MFDLQRLQPRTTAAQVAAVVVLAVVAGVVATALALTAVTGSARMRMNPDVKAASEAARIATMVREVSGAASHGAAADFIAGAQSTSGPVELRETSNAQGLRASNPFAERIVAHLQEDWRLTPVGLSGDAIFMRAGPQRLLVFHESEFQTLRTFLTFQAGTSLALIFCVITALAFYAVRSITRPLTIMAKAARAFARSPEDDTPLKAVGPKEIRQLAAAFSTMRDRTRRLINDRSRMMAAISHDMRTPLTRLRLRAERAADEQDRTAMLADVTLLEEMIREALTYLRDGQSVEQRRELDLPSMLQTICDQAHDMGHKVQFKGPARLKYLGQPGTLQRALSNIVDNATKHADDVVVTLQGARAGAEIVVADNGPGIPVELRERVFEPFFKVNEARTVRGFGLGLSIARDIVERHNGTIELGDNPPHGLRVRIVLPALKAEPEAMRPTAAKTAQSQRLATARG